MNMCYSGKVMAIILIFLTYFSFAQNGGNDLSGPGWADSTKKERRYHEAASDSTGRFVLINRVFIIGNRLTRDQITKALTHLAFYAGWSKATKAMTAPARVLGNAPTPAR